MSAELEERTFIFARDIRSFCRKLKWDIINIEDIRQLVRSSGSVGANYIEANENLGKADLRMRIRISRKEAKESARWLRLLYVEPGKADHESERNRLIDEAEQLKKIFSAILIKLEHSDKG
ncbi:MAG: four helix bundle protein [Sphingobacteriales bacterium]|nr:four helix bundle protein [Sphingobacteriales bacterium]